MSREEQFLARLQERLAALTPDRRTAHPGARPAAASPRGRLADRPAGLEGPHLPWVRRFASQWRTVGGECYAVPDRASLPETIARIVEEVGGGTVARTTDRRWDAVGLDAYLQARNVPVLPWGGGAPGAAGDGAGGEGLDRAALAEAAVGVTWPFGASAETGTLLEKAGPDSGRLVSLLPPVHVAVLEAERVFPHRGALFQALGETAPGFRGMVLITGPSRSGDIQNDLTIGVHGPKRAVVLLVGVGDDDV